MALHWQEIKGFNGTTGSNILYCWFLFKENNTLTDDNRDVPELLLNSTDTRPTHADSNNYGNLLISKKDNILLEDKKFIWGAHNQGNLTTKIVAISGYYNSSNKPTFSIYYYDNSSVIHDIADFQSTGISFFGPLTTSGKLTVNANGASITGKLYNVGEFEVTSNVKIGGNTTTTGWIKSSSYIYGTYFNAQSDRRAKDNIKPVTDSVLDIINTVQIYTFNYKQSNTHSIGLIAQDLMDKTLNGFNFIDNLDATGENDDYMSVHESKLVYILWKAVQELSAEVNELKKQLNK